MSDKGCMPGAQELCIEKQYRLKRILTFFCLQAPVKKFAKI